MAKKARLSLLQQQKLKLKKQRSLATTPRAKSLLDQKINRVSVQIVDTQKLLKGSDPPKALPAGKKGGQMATSNKPRRRNINSNPPSNKTRTGSQSVDSIKNEQRAVKRAQAEIGRKRMGPLSAIASKAIEALLSPAARGIGYQGGKAIRKALGGGEPTLDSKGNPIEKPYKGPGGNPSGSGQGQAQRSSKADSLKVKKPSNKTTNNASKPKPEPKPKPDPKPKPKPQPKPKPTNTSQAPRKTPKPTSTPQAPRKTAKPATTSNSQSLRAGRSPDKPAKKPAKKVYGSTGRKDLKQSKRMADALKNLKIRKYN